MGDNLIPLVQMDGISENECHFQQMRGDMAINMHSPVRARRLTIKYRQIGQLDLNRETLESMDNMQTASFPQNYGKYTSLPEVPTFPE